MWASTSSSKKPRPTPKCGKERTMAEVDPWLREMLKLKGSDLHLRADALPMWRIHGHLIPVPGEPVLDNNRLGRMMREIISEERWRRFEQTLDHDWAYALEDEARFRVNYLQQSNGYG